MINAFIMKDRGKYYLVPLATENKILLDKNTNPYEQCDKKKPLREHSIAMCWFDEPSPGKRVITLAVIVDLEFNDEKVQASRIAFDTLVDLAFQAAIQYTKRRKEKDAKALEIIS